MRLDEIGFYTMTERRAASTSPYARLSRCELILTGRCQFNCPYCRHVGVEMNPQTAHDLISAWGHDGLSAIRFSGGEPTQYDALLALVEHAAGVGIGRIAVSTNGAASADTYAALLRAGVNDFSISLDACCAEDAALMTGRSGAWRAIHATLDWLPQETYVTVGVVLTPSNGHLLGDVIAFAHAHGVADIRIIPAAQEGAHLVGVKPPSANVLRAHPILRYRIRNLSAGLSVRGLAPTDAPKCWLVLDDMAVMGEFHYPCIIWLREGGCPIGRVGSHMRHERARWHEAHNPLSDPICRANCLDVCRDYNTAAHRFHAVRLAPMEAGRSTDVVGTPREGIHHTPTGCGSCTGLVPERTHVVSAQSRTGGGDVSDRPGHGVVSHANR